MRNDDKGDEKKRKTKSNKKLILKENKKLLNWTLWFDVSLTFLTFDLFATLKYK